MQGDSVRAAKWLAGGLVASALVCVVGFHPMVTGRVLRVEAIAGTQNAYAPDPNLRMHQLLNSTDGGAPPLRRELDAPPAR